MDARRAPPRGGGANCGGGGLSYSTLFNLEVAALLAVQFCYLSPSLSRAKGGFSAC